MPTDYKKRMEQWIRESTEKMIEEKIKPIMKKLKHLRATFLQYAQERSIAGAWTEELKEDFEIIEALELDLNIRKRLLTGDMLLCNKLYKKYRVIYD
jgi:O-succinylbenzoate synthase